MIPQNIIELVLDTADIQEVISAAGIELRRTGATYVGKCPFHEDKSPSFHVKPAIGICKCFSCGEGGNAISFLMKYEKITYPEAVRKLASKYNIPIEEEKLSDEDRAKNLKRDALFSINEKVHNFYKEQLRLSDSAKNALSQRWTTETTDLIGIGFAPDSWDGLLNHARDNRMDLDLLLELGLLKKNEQKNSLYDSYRNRLIFPIVNRSGKVEGFSARDLSGDPKAAKYINSKDSEIYSKTKSLFGLGYAVKNATKEDRIYVVEGAADAMRLYQCKIYNTVAPLGTGLTTEHLKMIKRHSRKIVFLNDADDAGIKAVMKHGKTAMEIGLIVIVKEIPQAEDGSKQDPDTYVTSKAFFDTIPEKDFVLWYAEKTFRHNLSQTEQSLWVGEIAGMVAPITDVTINTQYYEHLSGIYGKASLWKKAVDQERAKKAGENKSIRAKDGKMDMDVLRKYGFWEEHGCYFGNGKEDSSYQYSNFTMEPMFHILDAINPKRIYKIKNCFGLEKIIELKQEDLISISKFKLKVESIGNFIWEAGERELIKMKKYLYEKTDTAQEVTQLGYQREGVYAFGNGIYDGVFNKADEYGIVRLDNINYYLPSASHIYSDDTSLFQFERKFVHNNYNDISLNAYCTQFIKVYGDNGIVGLCFLFATLFRDIVVNNTKFFPILKLFGQKGAGKSVMGKSLSSFFIADNNPPNIQNSTLPALADTVAQCSNAIVHLDEFKNSIGIDKFEFLKGLWDGTGRTRMNMDKDKKRETTSVKCGVILSGQEMATADIALFSRFVYIGFHKTTYTEQEKQDFRVLKDIETKGLTHLTLEIISLRKMVEQYFYRMHNSAISDILTPLRNEAIEDRVMMNWVLLFSIYKTVMHHLDLPFKESHVRKVIIQGIRTQNAECIANNELSVFWSVFAFLASEGKLRLEYDYRLETNNKMHTNKAKWEGKLQKTFLILKKDRIFSLYQQHMRNTNEKALPESTIKYYLENSEMYMGLKNSVRFKVEKLEHGVLSTFTSPSQGMVFDYDLLIKQNDIDVRYYNEKDIPGDF